MDHEGLAEAETTLAEQGYKMLDYVGKGNYAYVYTVSSKRYSEDVFCVKIIKMDTEEAESCFRTFRAELDTLLRLTHPNIVCVYAHFSSARFCYLVLEYCEQGSLADLIAKQGALDATTFRLFCRQLLAAISYLHSVNFCHRDIKPANILVDKYGRPKLADFGFAKDASRCDGKICGSLAYQSPELVSYQPSTNAVACDIWALGVTFYEMAFGQLPWFSKRSAGISSEICSGAISYPPGTPAALTGMLSAMIAMEPCHRKSADDILKMAFFAWGQSLPNCKSGTDIKGIRKMSSSLTLKKGYSGQPQMARSMKFLAVAIPTDIV
jgi:serine/threonine protein kinase